MTMSDDPLNIADTPLGRRLIYGPHPDDAPSFDEVEAAGLDGTLRLTRSARWQSPGRSDFKCGGVLSLVSTETVSRGPLLVTEYGDVRVQDEYDEEILDTEETSIWCSKCHRLGSDEYETHGISQEWQEV
jgi:hypothetical protein